MPEPFCKLEPPNEESKEFVKAVNERNVEKLDALLLSSKELRSNIDAHWFAFDCPAVVSASDSESVLKVLLKNGADINGRSSWWAGSFGVLDGASSEMARFLVDRGATYNIHSAAEQGRVDLISEFIAKDPSQVNARGGDGQTPLHVAKSIEVCDVLIEAGADLTLRCLDHSATAAQYAVSEPEKCRHLLLNGATPDIFMACALGDQELVEQIINDQDDVLSSRVGHCPFTSPVDERSHLHIYFWKLLGAETPLDVAREFDHPRLYETIFDKSSPSRQFIAACWEGDQVRSKRVFEANPNIMRQLTLHDQQELSRAAWEGRIETVRLMLEFGFDPHIPGAENSTPLDRAAFHGHREIVELLLENDPNPPLTFKNNFGGMPLDCCAYGATHSWKENTDHLGTCQALIATGAKVDPDWLPIENEEIDRLFRNELGL